MLFRDLSLCLLPITAELLFARHGALVPPQAGSGASPERSMGQHGTHLRELQNEPLQDRCPPGKLRRVQVLQPHTPFGSTRTSDQPCV
jgi:hypothetical protein